MELWHLPDGEQQARRDAFYNSFKSLFEGQKSWDGKPVDDPPSGIADPLCSPYLRGHKTVEFVSCL